MDTGNKPLEDNLLNKDKTEEKKIPYRFPLNNSSKIDSPIVNELSDKLRQNLICTSKYTYLTALPKILFEQFSRVANLYFLFLTILQIFPHFSQSGGSPILLIPLIIVVGVNGIKDFVEDYERKKSDRKENYSNTSIIRQGRIENILWKDITPGDIIKVKKNEYFPADILAVYSTNNNGSIFVETKNLDGETNLKYKECVQDMYNIYKDNEIETTSANLNYYIDCHEPYANLYEFEGLAYKAEKVGNSLNDEDLKGFAEEVHNKAIPLDSKNLLLRGSSLKNTEYIIGIVIYCGHSSKIMLNSLNARSKTSKITQRMNIILLVVVGLEMIMCIIYAIVQFCIYNKYKPTSNIPRPNILFNFFCWLLVVNNLVPISLLVTMEMIRFFQAYFMGYDAEMYDHSNRRFAVIQSSGLNEELGQVHYIFTDKTGTLTKNVMQFKQMVIANKTYGSNEHADKEELLKKGITNCDFCDDKFFDDFMNGDIDLQNDIRKYVFALALCHTIITENSAGKLNYLASSPDELALINAAKLFGVELLERSSDSKMKLKYNNEILTYKLLHVLEFNSDRKRMSVLIRDLKDNSIQLITKGADSHISPRLSRNCLENLRYTIKQLDMFGKKGLRTLLIASKSIEEKDYKEFIEKHQSYLLIQNSKEKEEKIDQLYDQFETEFELLGATAIEDCLQDHVEETLSSFSSIGIKVFMLTGDHPLTAISIAHSSGLINEEIIPVLVDSKDIKEIEEGLNKCSNYNNKKQKTCLVITGNALLEIASHLDAPDSVSNLFQLVLNETKCVICSRVSPKQKADIVTLVKSIDPSKTTLSIGDGANDVNMINTADIGIGIYGNEGQQAARASDYAIGQFSFLKRLLYVHGREAYRKNSFAVCYVLWKNFLYVTPLIIFAFYSRFSGQTMYDPVLDAFYNILFTAFPVGWFAITDKEKDPEVLENNPWKYRRGLKNKYFTPYIIIRWYGYGFLAGGLIYFVHYNVLCYTFINVNYNGYDMWTTGASMYTCIVFVVNFKLIFETHNHTIYTALLIVFSIGTFIILFLIGNFYFPGWKIYSVLPNLILSSDFWLMLLLTIMSYLVIEYGWKVIWFYIMKANERTKKIQEKKRLLEYEKKITQEKLKKSVSFDENEDPELIDKGYSVKLYTEQYTGYAFSEDVANIGIINDNINISRKKDEK